MDHEFSKYCTMCGLCCKNHNPTNATAVIKKMRDRGASWIPEEMTVFPYEVIDGACSKLTPEGLCSVYNTPGFPMVCDIGKAADALRVPRHVMFFHNARACLDYQIKYGWEGEKVSPPATMDAMQDSPDSQGHR